MSIAGKVLKTVLDESPYPVPAELLFEENDLDFIEAHDLEALARDHVIPAHGGDLCMMFDDFDIRYLWKREGGKSGGAATLGACQRPSGVLKYFAGCDFVIWVAADHTRGFTRHQMMALLFHELLHVGQSEKLKPTVLPHDFEGFEAEIRAYGFWRPSIEGIGRAVQLGLMSEMRRNGDLGVQAMRDLAEERRSPTHKEMVNEIVRTVVDEINTGALDGPISDGVTVRAWVGGVNDRPPDDGPEADDGALAAAVAADLVPAGVNGRGGRRSE